MANENISGNLPDFEGALAALRTVKSLGFRENEMEIPVPEEKPRQAEIPHDANFEELLDTGADSFHQSLLFSDFPYTQKGAFAFSMLSAQIAAAAPEPEKGTGARIFRFAKVRNADWAERIEDAKTPSKLAKVLDSLPASASSDRVMGTKYAVHGDGRNVHCHMKLAGSWKELFSMPFSEATWHVPGGKFLAAYSSGKGVYPAAGFHPSLGNLVFAATPYAEYCWVSEQAGASALRSAAQQFADFYDETYGLESSGWFADFFALSALIKNAAFAEIGGKRLYRPSFFANTRYLISKAEAEKSKGSLSEALFRLRTVSDLSLLALRTAPFGGRMLQLVKFFDASENMAPRRFVLDKGVVEALRALGADLEKSSVAAPISLKRGRDYSMESGTVSADFGTVISIMHLSQFFSREKGRNTFWSSLRSADAALFVASYGKRNSLSLLAEDTPVQRGSDIIKVEAAGTKLLAKRAMALETGKAKEIKAHLSRLIEVGDSRSVDERNSLEEMGSWGEAVYEFSSKGTDAALALVSSKRFY